MEYQEILRKIATAYTKILQDNLAGIYVHGSIAFGCFHWSKSDIDFGGRPNRAGAGRKKSLDPDTAGS